jgi:23S rRNA (guanine745-N1)-methyltransferase
MLAEVASVLRCPVCGLGLELREARLVCDQGHNFDIAREGYVNLMPGRVRHEGDSSAMVEARERFLAGGHFEPLAALVAGRAAAVALAERPVVLDLGASTGYYLRAVLDSVDSARGVALDASKFAARRAARAHDRVGSVVCDIWHELPVRDLSVQVALNVFSPRNGPEGARVLAPDGALLVVTPEAEHLAELVGPAGLLSVDERKEDRVRAELEPHLSLVAADPFEFELNLGRSDARALIEMGPSARHLSADEIEARLDAFSWPLPVTGAVKLWIFRPATP